MNKILAVMLVALATGSAQGAIKDKYISDAVSVTWQNTEDYRDVRTANGIKKRYQQRVFDQLERYLHQEIPKVILEDQTIKLTIHNLDLAGDVLPMYIDHQDIRVIKNIYPPMIDIEYQLLAADGSVIKSKREKVRDIGFNLGSHASLRHENLHYEKAMLKKWLRKQFKS